MQSHDIWYEYVWICASTYKLYSINMNKQQHTKLKELWLDWTNTIHPTNHYKRHNQPLQNTHTQTHKKNKCEKGWMNAVNSTNRPPWLFHYPLLGSGHWSFKSQWLLWHASWWIRQQWFTIAKRHLSGWRKTEFRPHNSPRKERKEVQRCWSKASRRDGLIKNQLDHFLANKQVPVNTFQ